MGKYKDSDILTLFNAPETREKAFRILVEQYQERLYHHVRRMINDHDDTDDMLQDIFIKIWKNLTSFRKESNLYTWIYRIATNECLRFIQKNKKMYKVSIENYEATSPTYSEFDDPEKIRLKLEKAIRELPPKQQLIFNMRYYDELTYEEISKILGTSTGALKAGYHHAVKKIEKSFGIH